jgi:hypothetical protein
MNIDDGEIAIIIAKDNEDIIDVEQIRCTRSSVP